MKKMGINTIEKKIGFQLGAGLDIPTCHFVTGAKGETLLNSVWNSVGVLGPTDSYKTALLLYMALTIIDRYGVDGERYVTHYDTEVNVVEDRINRLAKKFPHLPVPLIKPDDPDPIWQISDKSQYYADEWVPIFRDFVYDRAKDKRHEYTAYSVNGEKAMVLIPTVAIVDSLSQFEPKSTVDMLEKQKQEDGKTNTYYMKQGGYKDKFIAQVPVLTAKANVKFMTSAHIGKKVNMDANMYAPKETKQTAFMKEGEYAKGVSPKFFYLMNLVFYNNTATVLKNKTTKLPEFPLSADESEQETDLMIVRCQPLKNKSGAIGYTIPLIFSQKDGLLPHLSAFYYLKTKKFGIEGNDRTYNLVLLPDVKLSRTTVRKKINTNSKLRRALEILRDLHQLKVFHPEYIQAGLWKEPKQLYDEIIAQGYDWDDLLNTIDYPPIDSYSEDNPPHLSIVDLLRMAIGDYKPYWMD